jgi:hypothetical protein
MVRASSTFGYREFLAEIASHGFIVLAIGPYRDSAAARQLVGDRVSASGKRLLPARRADTGGDTGRSGTARHGAIAVMSSRRNAVMELT